MTFVSKVIGISFLIVAVSAVCFAQTDPKNVPQPPAAELKKFDPFLGKYNLTGDYAGLKWSGMLEIKPAIKGWYIERTLLVKTEGIDREFRSLITYDTSLKSYRVWGFETLPPLPPANNERSGRFEGNEFIEELETKRRDGSKGIHRNRYTMTDKDELRIVTESQDAAGKVRHIGVVTAKHVK